MMGNVIEFDADKAKKGLRDIADRAKHASKHLSALADAIDGAQQSLRANSMIQNGYCGSGLKSEIECARRLPTHIENAGKIVQAMIMETAL